MKECVEVNSEHQGPTITPQELRVVCDNMLQGLGRYLRCLGVDVKMLENTDDHKVAAEVRKPDTCCFYVSVSYQGYTKYLHWIRLSEIVIRWFRSYLS